MSELPNAPDAERATISAVLMDRDAMAPAAAILPSAGDMYDARHAIIWGVMLNTWENRTPPDLRLVSDALRKSDNADLIPYLIEIADYAASSYHINYYAQTVADAATRRRGIDVMQKGARSFADESTPLTEVAAAVQGDLDSALIRTQRRSGVTMAEGVAELANLILDAKVTPGICTGYRDLDAHFGGLQRSDLIILAARPAVGKSALALGLATQVAKDEETPRHVLYCSLEMAYLQLIQRAVAMETGIDVQRLRQQRLRESEATEAFKAMTHLGRLNMKIEDDAALTISDIRSKALREISQRGPLDLIVVDYLQLMQDGGGHNKGGKANGSKENRTQEVSAISRGLKLLARELDVPVVALSQLSRNVEGRTNHIPMLSDLRESGSIEQDADIVIFIYRDELYNPETQDKGVAQLIVAKNRNGPIGTIPLRFEASTTKFSNLTYRQPEGY